MINSFDFDGVIYMGKGRSGVSPGPDDLIITGRSFEESPFVLSWLNDHGIKNQVFFNPLHEKDKTRLSSGEHKARILNGLHNNGVDFHLHFEDDPIQKEVIERECPWITVVHLVHEETEK